jgi:histidinol phosphatase-like PHP family hydrolase
MMDMHNHTCWSGDANDTPEEIIENALKNGIKVIGITDHHRSVLKGCSDTDNLKSYMDSMDELKRKYKDRITVLVSLEINVNFYDGEMAELPYDMLSNLDYVLFEHVNGTGLFAPLTSCCLDLTNIGQIRSKIKSKAGLAHTNLLGLSKKYSEGRDIESGMDYIIKMLKDNDLFWEINIEQDYGYFDYITQHIDDYEVSTLFHKLRENGIKVSAGSDTHDLYCYDIKRLMQANEIASAINSAF